MVLSGCSSTPTPSSSTERPAPRPNRPALPPDADGPPDLPGPDPSQVPDAQPRVEPIRQGGPNKPYEVAGETYVPVARDEPMVEAGLASWYGRKFHGRRTASGEVYNMHAMTAAHKTMPIPSYAQVRNPANGREVTVRINDRGPFAAGRVIDLSYAAAGKLGLLGGVAPVEVRRLTHDDIRALNGSDGLSLARGPATAEPAAPSVTPVTRASTTPVTSPVTRGAAAPAEVPGPSPSQDRALTAAATGFWLQLGAFGRAEGAYSFQQKVSDGLDWLAPMLTIFADGRLHRLQAGPYPSREAALEAAQRVRQALQLVPVVVERR